MSTERTKEFETSMEAERRRIDRCRSPAAQFGGIKMLRRTLQEDEKVGIELANDTGQVGEE